jgi:hypothetical protein
MLFSVLLMKYRVTEDTPVVVTGGHVVNFKFTDKWNTKLKDFYPV